MIITEKMAVDETIQQEGRDAALIEFLRVVDNGGIMTLFDQWYDMSGRIQQLNELCDVLEQTLDEERAIVSGLRATLTADKATNEYVAQRTHEVVFELARASMFAHKEKNEVILQAIATLMRLSRGRVSVSDMDDIPF